MHCGDLVTNRQDKVSRVALAQLSGIIIASWLPIHIAVTDRLDVGILGVCLGYLAVVEGFNKYFAHKETTKTNGEPKPEGG